MYEDLPYLTAYFGLYQICVAFSLYLDCMLYIINCKICYNMHACSECGENVRYWPSSGGGVAPGRGHGKPEVYCSDGPAGEPGTSCYHKLRQDISWNILKSQNHYYFRKQE